MRQEDNASIVKPALVELRRPGNLRQRAARDVIFTKEELFEAYRLVVPEEKSRAHALLTSGELDDPETPPLGGWNQDTLLLLSLVSPDAARKAKAILRMLPGAWREQRNRLRSRLIAEGKLHADL